MNDPSQIRHELRSPTINTSFENKYLRYLIHNSFDIIIYMHFLTKCHLRNYATSLTAVNIMPNFPALIYYLYNLFLCINSCEIFTGRNDFRYIEMPIYKSQEPNAHTSNSVSMEAIQFWKIELSDSTVWNFWRHITIHDGCQGGRLFIKGAVSYFVQLF